MRLKQLVILFVTVLLVGALPAKVSAEGRPGDKGQDVVVIQYLLVAHGYVGVGPVDGVYGRMTTRAVMAWQRDMGLVVDGIAGPVTTASLKAAVRLNPPAPQPVVVDDQSSVQGVQAIIRDVWPDNLEDHAIAIASRETGRTFNPTVRNFCCIGLFQIYWTVHDVWLCPQLGICDWHQLQDARTNARAAYALYLRDGGWGPWAT